MPMIWRRTHWQVLGGVFLTACSLTWALPTSPVSSPSRYASGQYGSDRLHQANKNAKPRPANDQKSCRTPQGAARL